MTIIVLPMALCLPPLIAEFESVLYIALQACLFSGVHVCVGRGERGGGELLLANLNNWRNVGDADCVARRK